MRDYFDSDRLGLKPIETRDINCWKLLSVASRTGTEINTPVYASTQEATGDDTTQSKAQKRKKKRKKSKQKKKSDSSAVASALIPPTQVIDEDDDDSDSDTKSVKRYPS